MPRTMVKPLIIIAVFLIALLVLLYWMGGEKPLQTIEMPVEFNGGAADAPNPEQAPEI